MKTWNCIITSPNYIAQDKTLLDDFSFVLLCFVKLGAWLGALDRLVVLPIWLHGSAHLLFSYLIPSHLPLCIKASRLGQRGEPRRRFGRGGQNCVVNSCRKRPTGLIVFRSSIWPSCPRNSQSTWALRRLGVPPGSKTTHPLTEMLVLLRICGFP